MLTLAVMPTTAVLPVKPTPGWVPHVRAARQYAAHRPGSVAFSIRIGNRVYGRRSYTSVPAMSLMKPILLAAYLRRPDVRHRALRADERALLAPMIRSSDNEAANRVLAFVGLGGERSVARAVGMRDFTPFTRWGESRTSARDQALLFWRFNHVVPRRHRAFARVLLRTIVPQQRWGIARARPRGWRLYFKGGWGGSVDHQAALLTRGHRQIALAITTTGSPNHAVATETLRGITARLLRGINRG